MEQEEAVIGLKRKIVEASPAIHGGSKISSDPSTSRLTDVKTFTGSHKERFDPQTGKGLGKAGRVDPKPYFSTSGICNAKKIKNSFM
uniref:SJCHGC02172 protein n=1 Tax=Schistosoma japonicum TaxID=6182 RepID=Q5BTA2_SCHJA|nr:SJCHGC02172 protein [Schistosoma japonicum]